MRILNDLNAHTDGEKQQFAAGQAVSKTVDTFHGGVSGNELVVLIVSYARQPRLVSHSASVPLNLAPTGNIKGHRVNRRSKVTNQSYEGNVHVA